MFVDLTGNLFGKCDFNMFTNFECFYFGGVFGFCECLKTDKLKLTQSLSIKLPLSRTLFCKIRIHK